jgi:hypothetical protein
VNAPAPELSRPERILAQAAAIVDGIYFGLDFDVYLQVPRLGGGDVQDLCVSPATFWRGSWLDPDREQPDEEEKAAFKIGRAYHCARLTPHLFEKEFVRQPAKEDFAEAAKLKGACWNGKEIEAQLAALELPKKKAADRGVGDQGQRLEDAGYEGVIWPLIEARFWDDIESKPNPPTVIIAKVYDQIVRDMERIAASPAVASKLRGEPEVSVFWTDRHGLKRKARFDNLDRPHWSDLKTFDNSRGKRLDQAIADAVRFNRYYVIAAHYREASEAIRTGGLQIIGDATDAQRKLIAEIQIKPEAQDCWFIFQEKNGVPNLLARKFIFFDVPAAIENSWDTGASEEAQARGHEATRRPTQIYQLAMAEVESALRAFALHAEVYRAGQPWAPIDPMGTINDIDFSPFFLEGRQ